MYGRPVTLGPDRRSSIPAAIDDRAKWSSLLNATVFFTWWARWQEAFERLSVARRWTTLAICVLGGLVARFWAQSLPGNWDFGQWINVSSAVIQGQDPYALYGYNYPPPWLATVTLFNAVTSSDQAFRLLIAVLLAAADLGIAWLLVRRGYGLAACLFLLSPVVVAISGQHQQLEGITVFLALAAVSLLVGQRSHGDGIRASDWWAVLLLGLSLSFKPVFLLFPLWLAMRPGPWKARLLHFAGPLAVFGVIFSAGFFFYPAREVIQKVLEHSGANNSPFVNAFIPQQLAPWVLEGGGGKAVFLVALVAAGWIFRRLPAFELALAYSLSAVVFSWAMVNQYLAGPMAGVAVFLNVGFLIWLLMSTLYLGGSETVLNLPVLNSVQPHVLLNWESVMQDLLPWVFMGWVVFAFATRLPERLYLSSKAQDELTR